MKPDLSIRWALAGLGLATLLSSLGTSIANVALPTLAHAFGASFQDIQWIVVAYLLAITIFIVGAGRLGDRTGRRRLLLAGILLFTAASAAAGVAPTLGLLIAARALQGLGAAAMLALSMALIAETVPKERTGSAMGLIGTMSAVGTALGPALGGALVTVSGWRMIFLVNVPLGILAFVLAQRYLPPDRPMPSAQRSGLEAVDTRLLVASLATAALVAMVMMATLVVGPFYLSGALGLDTALVGLVLSVGPVVVALTGVPAGRVADRFGAQRAVVAGLVALVAGTLLLSLLPITLGIPGYVGAIVVITAGYSLFQTANNTALMADVPRDQRGSVSGMLNLARNVGLVAGASALGAVFALASATRDVASAQPEAVAAGMRTTFAVAGILMAAALAIAVASRRRL